MLRIKVVETIYNKSLLLEHVGKQLMQRLFFFAKAHAFPNSVLLSVIGSTYKDKRIPTAQVPAKTTVSNYLANRELRLRRVIHWVSQTTATRQSKQGRQYDNGSDFVVMSCSCRLVF